MKMQSWVLGLALLALTGCGGFKYNSIGIEGDSKAKEPIHHLVNIDSVIDRVFAGQPHPHALMHCKYKMTSEEHATAQQVHNTDIFPYKGCSLVIKWDKTVDPAIMAYLEGLLGKAALGAGLGAGLAFSGDETTITQQGGGGTGIGVGGGGTAISGSSSSSQSFSQSFGGKHGK